jgi:single-strand DNA-binding protein
MYLNRVTLIGYLAHDAERRSVDVENAHVILTLVTKTSWKNRAGEWQSHSESHRCVGWGTKFADFASGLKKGAHLEVEGELRSREYEKKGVTYRVFEIRIHSVLQLDKAWRVLEPPPQDEERPEGLS